MLGRCEPMNKPGAGVASAAFRSVRPLAGSLLLVAVVALCTGCRDAPKASARPAPTVQVEAVTEKDVPIHAEWVGTLVGYITAQIHSRVTGYLISQNYKEGSLVKTGDLLFQVDPRPFQAAVDQQAAKVRLSESQVTQTRSQVTASQAQVLQAKATVAQAEADIKRAEANQRKTELDVSRYTPLAERGSVSQQELDDAVQNNQANLASVAAANANLQNAQANVARAQAALEKAQADVETAQADVAAQRAALADAQLNLGYTKVISPIDGIAGFRVANIGDLVGPPSTAVLTTVSQVEPIFAEFPISEQLATRIFRRWETDPTAPRSVDLELILADGSTYPKRGKAEILDRQVGVTTGTVMARGTFQNPGNVLRPGQYAKIRAIVEQRKNALLVPQRAVRELQSVREVVVVGPDDTAEMRTVTVGERIGSLWIIDKGLKPGERVIVEGADKVRAGEKVKPVLAEPAPDRQTPKASAAPAPAPPQPSSGAPDRGKSK